MSLKSPAVLQFLPDGRIEVQCDMSREELISAYQVTHTVDHSMFRSVALEICVNELLAHLERRGAISGQNFHADAHAQMLREQCLARTG